ncbi:MAG TPA: MotA/TolQ/ExbB proton channel family protein [Polyangiaceae bacterium]|nr:MotA/TolQ/ExbB proton channel family protein [Polyangiaceae bacterium]
MSDAVTQFIVKATFVLLIAASALTWAIVIVKALQNFRLSRQTQSFYRSFEKTSGLPSSEDLAKYAGPVARVAQAGIDSWQTSGKDTDGTPVELPIRRDLLERRLIQQLQREKKGVEIGLPVLASIGSTSPFVGLFGTVLGIIHALQRIGGSGSASLEVVAGPIGEALEATAVGIAVAVPALIAYNFFLRRLKSLVGDLEDFSNTFIGHAVRSFIHVAPESQRRSNPSLAIGREASA